jgi:hypothetical protein
MSAVLSLSSDLQSRKHLMRAIRYSLALASAPACAQAAFTLAKTKLAITARTLPNGELERYIVSAGD